MRIASRTTNMVAPDGVMLTITRYIDDSGRFVFNNSGREWPEGAGGGMFCRKGVQLGSVLKVSS